MPNDQEILDEQTAAPAVEPTMAETMADTLSEIRSRDTEVAADPLKVDRTRAPDGKFAKGTPEDVTPKTAAPAASPAEKVAPAIDPAAAASVAPVASIAPPSSYTAEAKAEFAKASPVIQREILKRESDFHKGVEQYKQAANYAQSMYGAVKPYENTIKSWGVTPDIAVKALFEADRKLSQGSPQEKLAAFANLAKGYGIDLSQGMPEAQPVDPNMQYMQSILRQQEQRFSQLERQNHEYAARVAQQEQSELNSLIEQAKQGKPHFDELRQEIGLLLQAGINKGQPVTIDQAYEAALWQSPTHRNELLAKQRSEFEAEAARKRAEDAEKAKAARQASSTNVARRGTLPAQKAVGTMQDTMRETLEQIKSR